MEVIEFGRLSDALVAELEGDEVDPFQMAGSPLRWRDKDRHVGIRESGGRLVAAAGLVPAEVETADGAVVAVVGLGGVIVAAPFRGRGLGDRVITAALELANRLGPAIAMLFCRRDRVGLYARYDFFEIAAPVFAEQPTRVVEMPVPAMWRPLRTGATLAPGAVTVRGLPF